MTTHLHDRLKAKKRARSRGRFFRKTFFYLLVLLIIAPTVVWYLFSERFKIQDVEISGARRVSEDALRENAFMLLEQKYLYILPKNFIWTVDKAGMARDLKKSFPSIKDIEVRRKFFRTITISFREYEQWGVLCHREPEECFWVDRDGALFESAPSFSGLIVPKIKDKRSIDYTIGGRYLSAELMKLITFFNERTLSDNNLQSLQFAIDEKDETLQLKTRGGWDILLLASNDPEAAYKNLTLALLHEIKDRVADLDYIDLRFGSRIFYKFKN